MNDGMYVFIAFPDKKHAYNVFGAGLIYRSIAAYIACSENINIGIMIFLTTFQNSIYSGIGSFGINLFVSAFISQRGYIAGVAVE